MEVTPNQRLVKLRRLLMLFLLVNAIGLGVGVAIWVYALEIEAVNGLRLQLASRLPRLLVLPLMGALGGGLAGALISGVEPGAKGSGIIQVMVWLRGLPVPMGWKVALVKLLASGVAIGGGLPVGPEGPSIQIGASMAKESAGVVGAKGSTRRSAVAIGSGAGLAAIFHSPLGGLAYTLEELLKKADIRVNAIATFATFATVAWTRLLSAAPTSPAWVRNLTPVVVDPSRIDTFRLVDIPFLLLLGVLAGLLAMQYQRWVLRLLLLFRRWRLPPWQLLPLVGLVIGAGAAALPSSFDSPDKLGFDALLGLTTPVLALLALVVQAIGTAVAVAAEAPGGILAPALVVGASLGTLLREFSLVVVHYAPASLLFAGGAAFLGALTRTPLTAILLSFELSKDYALLLPIGFAVLAAIAVADLFERDTLFDLMREETEEELRRAG